MKKLPGGSMVWIFAAVEAVTFGLFFLAYASSAATDASTFSESQTLLHPLSGAINTGVLLFASWAAARAVGKQWWWWALASGAGVVFLLIKGQEYVHIFAHGVSLSTNLFWFFYLFLTLFHAMHVIGGIVIGGIMAFNHRQGDLYRGEPDEAAAIYWHIVDLIWIVLFPLLYLMHPTGGM